MFFSLQLVEATTHLIVSFMLVSFGHISLALMIEIDPENAGFG